jgi:transposase
VCNHLPDADRKIVFDKYHIASHLGEAVDLVRRQKMRFLVDEGDQRPVGTKYLWLCNSGNFRDAAWDRFQALGESTLRTAGTWALKESAISLFNFVREESGWEHFQWWYNWSTHSRLKPAIEVSRTLKARLANIRTYLTHPITNATSESLNAKIQWVEYTARGFQNKHNFKTAICYHCGGLELAPLPT